jgi:flavin reductase (NADH)
MSKRPIDVRIRTGREEVSEGQARSEAFREAMARWVSGVTIVAVRDPDDGKLHGTTVGSLISVSADPPRIAFSLGPGAQVLPFLPEDRPFVVNILSAGQAGLATRYADAFPIGPSPFPDEGAPAIPGAQANLFCAVEQVVSVGSSRLVLGRVEKAQISDEEEPLVYWNRDYRQLGG